MRIFTVIAVIFSFGLSLFPRNADAGFEFVAPKAQPKISTPYIPNKIVPSTTTPRIAQPYNSMAVPMRPVMREPLAPSAPSVPAVRTYQNSNSLVINPYPLNAGKENHNINNISSGSVNRALIEESGLVTPMPLGENMQTGAQVDRANRLYGKDKIEHANYSNVPTSLVPIPGVNSMPVEQQKLPVKTFSPAVGFGNDIPLSIVLDQVIPDGFNAKLPNESLGDSIVSWQGGKPWNQVLNDVLMPLGYRASVKGNDVIIEPYLRG